MRTFKLKQRNEANHDIYGQKINKLLFYSQLDVLIYVNFACTYKSRDKMFIELKCNVPFHCFCNLNLFVFDQLH